MIETSELPQKFNIIREGDNYFLLLPQAQEYKLNRYRHARHGRNKWDYRMEPVHTSHPRTPITQAIAQQLIAEAHPQGYIENRDA